jgi:hypothetical protein
MAASLPSNSVSITNVLGRDGTATGAEVFISIGCGGGRPVTLKNIVSTGHIQLFTANDNQLTIENIDFTLGSAIQRIGGTPRSGHYVLSAQPGQKTIINSGAIEVWTDANDVVMYQNDRGRVRVASLQGIGAAQDAKNFGGAFTLGNTTTATVTFATAEPDTSYRVICIPNQIVAGAPAAGSGRIASIAKTVNDFTVTVETAPGPGNSLAFAWMIFRA